ncbi:MAG TPA: antiterminator LoaP [Treponemataceae bacterium]|jgi:transcriptional antiterminator NusG|nr:MAG: hypothetical protein BWY39_01692 [Spirochaetes bacterium ADurb.Bin269]TAH54524.1 MAG: antiterminator LoaP [Treponema sp.]HOC30090.1 antiterminator LoaP [Treponemataceae bacterium]HQL32941.1 antiterminator LoaP [Treponemataceae bacterium]
MNYYALQVKTNAEEQYIIRATISFRTQQIEETNLLFPRRKLTIRKDGATKNEIQPVFPGYIFLESESLSNDLYWVLRTTPGFYRFLPENKEPKPLVGRDLATLKHFLSFGAVAEKSRVRFDENDRIVVADGPLKGLEGRIVKVDKRKGRAKVQLDMYDDSFLIDLAFEVMGSQ